MANPRKVKEALLPNVVGQLERLERELTGACTGWGPNASGMKSVRSALGYVRHLIETSDWEIVDPHMWGQFRTHLASMRISDQREEDPDAYSAWQKFRWSGWTCLPPERHRRKRAALQAEVDDLYRTDQDG